MRVKELPVLPLVIKPLPPDRIVAHYVSIDLEKVKPKDVLVGHITFKVSKNGLKPRRFINGPSSSIDLMMSLRNGLPPPPRGLPRMKNSSIIL